MPCPNCGQSMEAVPGNSSHACVGCGYRLASSEIPARFTDGVGPIGRFDRMDDPLDFLLDGMGLMLNEAWAVG